MEDSATELQLFQSRVRVLTFPVIGFKSISYALYLLVLWPLSDCRIERLFFFFLKIDV